MNNSEKLKILYDDIVCELSFCNSVNEIIEVIDSEFAKVIKYEEEQESVKSQQLEKKTNITELV